MTEEQHQLSRRLEELARRAQQRGCRICSEFLTPAEQTLLRSLRLSAPWTLEGGYEGAERCLACFGEAELYDWAPPITCLCIAPSAPKFAETLSHRDFLGALMGLGLRREVLGDVILWENRGYLFCLDSIAPYIAEQLREVRRTAVRVTAAEAPPAEAVAPPPVSQVVVASKRLDALVVAVYHLSRSESRHLLESGRVFVNGCEELSADHMPAPGDKISLRGYGRFSYEGVDRETRKGRLRANVRVY